MRNKTILLTGCAGFTGFSITKSLLEDKFEIAKKLKWNGEKEVVKIIKSVFNNKLLFTP